MSSWLSKIRLWEIALTVFIGFGCYFLWTATRSDTQVAAEVSTTLSAANTTIANANSVITQAGSTFSSVAGSISQTEKDVRGVATQLNGVAAGLQKTEALINAPCVPGPCGTVADIGKTLNTGRLAIGQVEIAANSFDKNQTHFYKQEDQLYKDADQSFNNFNTLLSSSDLTGSIHNFNTISHNLSKTTTDFQTKFHDFLYPPPCKGFKCWIKTGYEAIRIGSQLMQPAYYGWAISSGVHP